LSFAIPRFLISIGYVTAHSRPIGTGGRVYTSLRSYNCALLNKVYPEKLMINGFPLRIEKKIFK